jgi:hypothetical protein
MPGNLECGVFTPLLFLCFVCFSSAVRQCFAVPLWVFCFSRERLQTKRNKSGVKTPHSKTKQKRRENAALQNVAFAYRSGESSS